MANKIGIDTNVLVRYIKSLSKLKINPYKYWG